MKITNTIKAKDVIKKKNILFIEANTDGTIGGSHYCLLELIKGLNKSKFKPFVLFYQKNILIPEFERHCPVIILDKTRGLVIKRDFPHLYALVSKIPYLPYFLILFQKTYNFFRYYLTDFLKIIYLLSKLKIDLVHINNAPALTDWLIAAKILKIKCIGHLRGNWDIGYLQKKLLKFYDAVIAISQSVINYLKKKGVNNTNNFVIIHDGIDIDAVLKTKEKTPDEIRKELAIPSNSNFLLGLIGNIKAWKGQHVAIEAIKILKKKYPKIKCLIVGNVSNLEDDKKYFNYLKELVNNNGLSKNIIFTGFRKDIPDIISALDILIHTSVAPEPFGRVILEGMIFSKPVIATSHGGPIEIIEDGISGFLVPPNDPNALAQKIDYLISNLDTAKKIGQIARKRVEECFSIQINIKKIEQLYTNILSIF